LFVIEHLYILFFFLKICFGVSVTSKRTLIFDLNFFEVVVFLYLFYFSIFFGIFPAELSWKLFI
jgi:NADH:ubiquinone oxidoreductase subunit 4 (subunit M)